MGKPLLPDGLWERIKPLLPPEKPRPKGGRPRVSDRLALTGILFVARTGTAWELLPAELGCGSGMTCWRRLRDWQVSGIWQRSGMSCWMSWVWPTGLTGPRQWLTAVRCGHFLGGENWPQSHGSREKRLEKASHQRWQGDPARGDPDRGQCP